MVYQALNLIEPALPLLVVCESFGVEENVVGNDPKTMFCAVWQSGWAWRLVFLGWDSGGSAIDPRSKLVLYL